MQFNIDKAISVFKTLAHKAFIKRQGTDIPLIRHLVVAHHHGLYRTSPLEMTLKEVFREDPIFGAPLDTKKQIVKNLKVAVTMTSHRNSFLVGNYNRPSRQKPCIKKKVDERGDLSTEKPQIVDNGTRSGTAIGPGTVIRPGTATSKLIINREGSDGEKITHSTEEDWDISDAESEGNEPKDCDDSLETPLLQLKSDEESDFSVDEDDSSKSSINLLESADNSPEVGKLYLNILF